MNESAQNYWSYSRIGYLTVMDWGYALALLAYLRNEKKPDWFSFLSRSLEFDFNTATLFIEHNKDLILK